MAKLSVPLKLLHHDGMGGLVVGPERPHAKRKGQLLIDMISISDGCWTWRGSVRGKPGNTYGCLVADGARVQAHRFVYELVIGPIPDGYLACHSCDNTMCVNPWHVFPGTPLDNMLDKKEKGRCRNPRGETSPLAKLKEADVAEMKAARERGDVYHVIAKRYGITTPHAWNVINGKFWRHTL